MPLEPCPHCGYALSILDHHCRHCASAGSATPDMRFHAKYLPHILAALVLTGLLVYFVLFHGFG